MKYEKLIPNNLRIGNITIKTREFEIALKSEKEKALFAKCIKNGYIKELAKVEDTKPDLEEDLIKMSDEEIAKKYSVKELKAYAKKVKIPKYSGLNQEELITALKS